MSEYLNTRAEIIKKAKNTIASIPQWQRDALKREFDRAEEEAEFIRTHPGSRQ